MNEPTMGNMVKRLDRLERENRRLKCIGALILVGIAAVLLMGQGTLKPRIIEAEGIVLKDTDGAIRGILGRAMSGRDLSKPWHPVRAGGAYGVHLYGPDGRYKAGLLLHENLEASLVLYSQEHGSVPPSRTRVLLGVRGPASRGLPYLAFMDDKGETRLELGYVFEPSSLVSSASYVGPAVRMYNRKGPGAGKVIWKAP